MKPKKIIKYLEMVKPTENCSHTFSVLVGNTRHFGPGSQLNKDVSKAIDLAIEALEKQVPKPIKYATRCPACDEIWYGDGDGYCNNCGQKLEDVNYRKEVKE